MSGLGIHLDGCDLEHHQSTNSIVHWIHSGQRSTHIKENKCTGPRGPRTAVLQSHSED